MSTIDNAVLRLQALALQVSGIKAAPNYPVEDATVLPLAIAHISSGEGSAQDATFCKLLYTISVDFHVSRISLKQAYKELDAIIPAYHKLLAGDPTLGGAVDTIIFPVPVQVAPAEWDSVITEAAFFTVQIKSLEAPTAST